MGKKVSVNIKLDIDLHWQMREYSIKKRIFVNDAYNKAIKEFLKKVK